MVKDNVVRHGFACRVSLMLAVLVIVASFLSPMSVMAAEKSSADSKASEKAKSKTEKVIKENADTAFSISGNATVVDDIADSSTKEFYTIRSANNNTYYLIVDRSATSENVYMLSTIDENDLMEFVTEGNSTPVPTTPSVVDLDEEPATVVDDTDTHENDSDEEKSGMGIGAMLMIILLAAGGLGAGYYFKIYKPKHEEDDFISENMEYSDGYISGRDQFDRDELEYEKDDV